MAFSSTLTASAVRLSYSPPTYSLKNKQQQQQQQQQQQRNFPLRNRRAALVVVRAEGGINPSIRKEEPKVVDNVKVSELSKPLTPYCRCWRSGTFPLCDGSHVKHNKETGDNVGPLLLKK